MQITFKLKRAALSDVDINLRINSSNKFISSTFDTDKIITYSIFGY